MGKKARHIFIIGAKGIGEYGGYETFVKKLVEYHKEEYDLEYHIACKANGIGCMELTETLLEEVSSHGYFKYNQYRNVYCHVIPVNEKLKSAQAIIYDCSAIESFIKYVRKEKIDGAILYILACRIGPFINRYKRILRRLNVKLFLNPDGHEWMRSKWSLPVRKYWKMSEKMMVKSADLVICDSKNIEEYIHEEYDSKRDKISTTFIAYGSETRKSKLADDDILFAKFLDDNKAVNGQYYLIVGRFVPENNYETMIREFVSSESKKKLIIITNENDILYNQLNDKFHFEKDDRVCFAGTVYNQELLMKIRENAFAYLHGHEVGGTNPSLLEALGSTKLNLLLDVGFNKEVAKESAFYWNKVNGDLSALISRVESLRETEIEEYSKKAKQRIIDEYSWPYITGEYKKVFLQDFHN